MRLLKVDASNNISLSDHFLAAIPPYAILSHTWGPEEVTYDDIRADTGSNKRGYQKILFCGQQAARDGLQYFWVDTCCIDKSNSAELSEAIISMFRWYHNAAKCYVYLEDVPSFDNSWLSNFEKSRWFKRGWTLQELIAPRVVEFFAKGGQLLGTKSSLEEHIHSITGIEESALRNDDLSTFSIKQRFSWTNSRQTTREEDQAYCLLGIFGINMTPLYGEGAKSALDRLKREISAIDPDGIENRAKIAAWLSAPAHHCIHEAMRQAEGTCEWIFEDGSWQTWTASVTASVLWIYGEPGVGKTVLASAAINKIKSNLAPDATLAYFYCNAGDIEQHKAEAIIASLVKQLLLNLKQPVPDAVQELYERARQSGSANDRPTVKSLCDILQPLHSCYLVVTYIIDGLDECSEDERGSLLDVFLPLLQRDTTPLKLLLTSRNKHDIATRLSRYPQIVVDVTKNSADIRSFVKSELSQAVEQRRLLQGQVTSELFLEIEDRLSQDACGMFLWARLQIPILCSASSEKRLRHILANYPRQLDKQYDRMLSLVRDQEADVVALAMDILLWTTFSFRPCTSKELWTAITAADHIIGFDFDDLSAELAVNICHNFLQLDATHDGVVLLHTSARQYLTKWFGSAVGHGNLASQCACYLASCGFDRQVEQLLNNYVDPEEIGEPTLPEEERNEGFMEMWTAVEKMILRSKTFGAFRDTYPFLHYAGNYWLQHADLGMEHFALSAFPWMLNENSSVFSSWRALNSIEGGLVLQMLGDLGIDRLENQIFSQKAPDIVMISAHLGLSKLLFKVLEVLPDREHKHRALAAAACTGMAEIVAALVSDKDALSAPGPFGALMMAAPSSHVSVVSLLLEAVKRAEGGANDGRFTDCSMVATIGACLSPKEDMIKAVYEICGNQNPQYGVDMVKVAARMAANIRDPIQDGLREVIDDLDRLCASKGWSPLMVASLRGNEHAVPILLKDEPDAVIQVQFALSIAAVLGHQSFAKALIQHASTSLSRARALGLAIAKEDEDMVELLIDGDSPLRLALLAGEGRVKTIVGVTAAVGNVPIMKRLVLRGFNLRIQDDARNTALHHAVENGREDMIQYLLEKTSAEDFRIQNADGETPLDIAKARGFHGIVMIIRTALDNAPRRGTKRKVEVEE